MVPLHLFLDPEKDIIVFKYSIHQTVCPSVTVEFESKSLKIKVPRTYSDDEISSLAQNILKSSRIIPKPWLFQIEECLLELNCRRKRNESRETTKVDYSIEIMKRDLDHLCNQLYESDYKILEISSRKLLDISVVVENLDIVIENHQLMSVMTRILGNKIPSSMPLKLNIVHILMIMSGFEILHSTLSDYQVGVIMLDLLTRELEVLHHQDYLTKSDYFQRNLTCSCMNVLLNLADKSLVSMKMIKRGLIDLLARFIDQRVCIASRRMALLLLHKVSIFREVSKALRSSLKRGLSFLFNSATKISRDNTINLIVRVWFNLSFHRAHRRGIVKSGVLLSLQNFLMQHNEFSEVGLKLVFRLSSDSTLRPSFNEYPEIIFSLLKLIERDSFLSNEARDVVEASLANFSSLPAYTEILNPYIEWCLNQVESNHSFSSAVAICNISICNFRNRIKCNEPTKNQSRVWCNHVPRIARLVTSFMTDNSEISTQLIFAMAHFANEDLPENKSWIELNQDFNLFETFSSCVSKRNCGLRLKEGIITFCQNIALQSIDYCENILKSTLMSSLSRNGIYQSGNTIPKLQSELMKLIQIFLSYHELVPRILQNFDLIREIFSAAAKQSSYEVINEAVQCLNHLIYSKSCSDILKPYAICIRFLHHNALWSHNSPISS